MIPVDSTLRPVQVGTLRKGDYNMSIKKSLADFKSAHDKSYIVPTKIKAGLEKLGSDGWEYEPEFIKLAGVSAADVAKFREQFAEQVVLVRNEGRERRVWAGSKALANKMREMI